MIIDSETQKLHTVSYEIDETKGAIFVPQYNEPALHGWTDPLSDHDRNMYRREMLFDALQIANWAKKYEFDTQDFEAGLKRLNTRA